MAAAIEPQHTNELPCVKYKAILNLYNKGIVKYPRGRISKKRLQKIFKKIFEPKVLLTDIATLSLFQDAKDAGIHHNVSIKSEYSSNKCMQYYQNGMGMVKWNRNMVKEEMPESSLEEQEDKQWTKVDICEEMLHREVKKEFDSDKNVNNANLLHMFEPNFLSEYSSSDTVCSFTGESSDFDKPLNLAKHKSKVTDVNTNMQIVPTGLEPVENELLEIYRPNCDIENELHQNKDYVEQFQSMLDNYNIAEFDEVFGKNMEDYHAIHNEPFIEDIGLDILPHSDPHINYRSCTESRLEYYCDKSKVEFMSKLGLQSIHQCTSPVVNVITVQDDGTCVLVNQKKYTYLLDKDLFNFTNKALMDIGEASDAVDLTTSHTDSSNKCSKYDKNQIEILKNGNSDNTFNSVEHNTSMPTKQISFGKNKYVNGKLYRKGKLHKHKHSFHNNKRDSLVTKHRSNNNCKQRLYKNSLKMYARDFQIYAHQRKNSCSKVIHKGVKSISSPKSRLQFANNTSLHKNKSVQDNDLKLLNVINKLKNKKQNKHKIFSSGRKQTEITKLINQDKLEQSVKVKHSELDSICKSKEMKDTEQRHIDKKEYFMRQRKVLKFPSSYEYTASTFPGHKSNGWMRVFKSQNRTSCKNAKFNSKHHRKHSKKLKKLQHQIISTLDNALAESIPCTTKQHQSTCSLDNALTESISCSPKQQETGKQKEKRRLSDSVTDDEDIDNCEFAKEIDNLSNKYISKEGKSGKKKRKKVKGQSSAGDNPARILKEFSQHNWLLNKYHLLSEKSNSEKSENESPKLDSVNVSPLPVHASSFKENHKTSDTKYCSKVSDASICPISSDTLELNDNPTESKTVSNNGEEKFSGPDVEVDGPDVVEDKQESLESDTAITRTSTVIPHQKTSSAETIPLSESTSSHYNHKDNRSPHAIFPPNVTVIKPANNVITPVKAATVYPKIMHTAGPILPKVVCGGAIQTKHNTVQVLPPPVIVICNSNIPPPSSNTDSQINQKTTQPGLIMNSHTLPSSNVNNVVQGYQPISTCYDNIQSSQYATFNIESIKIVPGNYMPNIARSNPGINSTNSCSAIQTQSVSSTPTTVSPSKPGKQLGRPVLPKLPRKERSSANNLLPVQGTLQSSSQIPESLTSKGRSQDNTDVNKLTESFMIPQRTPYSEVNEHHVSLNDSLNRPTSSNKVAFVDLTLDNGTDIQSNEMSATLDSRYRHQDNSSKSQSLERNDSDSNAQTKITFDNYLSQYQSTGAHDDGSNHNDDQELRKLKQEYDKVNRIFKRLTDIEQKKDKERRLLQQKKMQTTQLMQTIKHHYESLQRGKIVGSENIDNEPLNNSSKKSSNLGKTPPPAHSNVLKTTTPDLHIPNEISNTEDSRNRSNDDAFSPVDLSKKCANTNVPGTTPPPTLPFQSRMRNNSIPYPPPLISMSKAQENNQQQNVSPKNVTVEKVSGLERDSPIYIDGAYSAGKDKPSMDTHRTNPLNNLSISNVPETSSNVTKNYSKQHSPGCQINPPSTNTKSARDCQIIPSTNVQVIQRPPVHGNMVPSMMPYSFSSPNQVQQIAANSPQIVHHRPPFGELPTLVSSNKMNHANQNASVYANRQQLPMLPYYSARIQNMHQPFSNNQHFHNSPAFPPMQRPTGHYQFNPNYVSPQHIQGVTHPGQMVRVRQNGASQPYPTQQQPLRHMNTKSMESNTWIPNHGNKTLPNVGQQSMGHRFAGQHNTEATDMVEPIKTAVMRNGRNALWQQYTHGKLRCGVCQRPAMFVCSQCKEMPYCSEACQTKSWPKHGPMCAKYIESKKALGKPI